MSLLEIAAVAAAVLAALAVILLVLLLGKSRSGTDPVLLARLEALDKGLERSERELRDELARGRDEAGRQASASRQEMTAALKGSSDSLRLQMEGFGDRLARLTESNERKIDALRAAVEGKLAQIQADNAAKLEEMRRTVDEKLQGTLERRLGESFRLVSERLEEVHKGLGEMQTLATGVGDLKKVLANVKVRGTWGEMQLGSLLEDILVPDQYAVNVATRPGSSERVEFAVKLPGRDDADGRSIWLPIDAKFPKEDYERLVEASERGDAAAVEEAARQLENRVRAEAKEIRDKYLEPPHTTDFGILYLSTEGLYAEILRRPGLTAMLQREYRVNVAGPTTLAALLNSLQMGFRTLAVEKRSSEVWSLLGAVKNEFGKFGEVIDNLKKKMQGAVREIDSARRRTRVIEGKLKKVQELPAAESRVILEIGGPAADEDAEDAPPDEIEAP